MRVTWSWYACLDARRFTQLRSLIKRMLSSSCVIEKTKQNKANTKQYKNKKKSKKKTWSLVAEWDGYCQLHISYRWNDAIRRDATDATSRCLYLTTNEIRRAAHVQVSVFVFALVKDHMQLVNAFINDLDICIAPHVNRMTKSRLQWPYNRCGLFSTVLYAFYMLSVYVFYTIFFSRFVAVLRSCM